jgi:hypothetical protein
MGISDESRDDLPAGSQPVVHDEPDAELRHLSTLGREATIFFSVSASSVAFAVGIWLSIADGIVAAGPGSTAITKFLVYAGMPFFTTFAIIAGILGRQSLRRHRAVVREMKRQIPAPKTFVVTKDGMQVDIPPPPPK